jgi:hypothetical protein
MGEIQQPEQVLPIVAAFSCHEAALAWAADRATAEWGGTALTSDAIAFDATDYYQSSMGSGLRKQFWAFEQFADQGDLAERKILTNQWEQQYAEGANHGEPRPLNIDPGYLSRGKLVLASTKDHSHRIYLRDGIYAEVTLYYKDKQWQAREWTFPDYRRADYHAFFDQCRDYLKERLRKELRA